MNYLNKILMKGKTIVICSGCNWYGQPQDLEERKDITEKKAFLGLTLKGLPKKELRPLMCPKCCSINSLGIYKILGDTKEL